MIMKAMLAEKNDLSYLKEGKKKRHDAEQWQTYNMLLVDRPVLCQVTQPRQHAHSIRIQRQTDGLHFFCPTKKENEDLHFPPLARRCPISSHA